MTFAIARSKTENDRFKRFVPSGTHYSFRTPWESKNIHFVRGNGSRLWDLDGNEYIDLFNKFGANLIGHNDRDYLAALHAATDRALAVNLGTCEADVADRICAHIPSAEMVRFSMTGTEAVLNALRLARGITGKPRFVRFFTHYHGNADCLLGGRPGHSSRPLADYFAGDLTATEGMAQGACDEAFLLPWNDAAALADVLATYGDEIAAVLTEPICINGGGVLPIPGYLEAMRHLCDRYGALLIFDEVITGFRTGLGGAQARLGVTPDLTTLGKALSGGAMPVSALAGRREIMGFYDKRTVVHGGTFNGYPLGMAAARATIEILEEADSARSSAMVARMQVIQAAFVEAAAGWGIDIEMKGIDEAAVFHIRIAEDCTPKHRAGATFAVKLISEAMAEHGILISNMNRFYGSLALDDSDVALFAERIGQAFALAGPFIRKMAG